MQHRLGQLPYVFGMALGVALCAGCHSPIPSEFPPQAPLRIGVVDHSPPLIFKENRRWKGVEAELGRAFAARLGKRSEFIAFPREKLSRALLDGKVDILMAGIPVTEERRVLMDFSTPYLVVGQAALIRPADLLLYNTKIKLRSARARVGIIEGSTADKLVSRYFIQATRVVFPNSQAGVKALQDKKIDYWLGEAPSVWWLAQHHTPPLAMAPGLFAKEELAWAFRQRSVSLREAANQALVDWQQDGTLEMVLGRWLPFSK